MPLGNPNAVVEEHARRGNPCVEENSPLLDPRGKFAIQSANVVAGLWLKGNKERLLIAA